jgi:hypothetical protein
LRAKIRVAALDPDAKEHLKQEAKIVADPDKDFPIEPLGSGSDFSSFIDFLGVPALDVGFYQEGESAGVYHSRYDTFEHHSRFVDPGFVYDSMLAKTAGRLVMRVAEADLPVQRASGFADLSRRGQKTRGHQARGGRNTSQTAARSGIPTCRRSDQIQRLANRTATRPARGVCRA